MSDFSKEEQLVNAIIAKDLVKTKELLSGIENIDYQSTRSQNYSFLHFAAQSQSSEIADLLIAKGVDTELVDKYGNTALWVAVFNYRGDGAVLVLLLSQGADANHKNQANKSPAELANTIANYNVSKYFVN